MDFAKVERLFNEQAGIQVFIANDEYTLEDVFEDVASGAGVSAMSEFNAYVDGVLEDNPELTEEKKIVCKALSDYLKDFYYDNYDQGDYVLFKLGDEELYEDVVVW